MIKKYFSALFLIFSVSILLYTFYRSEIYWDGEKSHYYYKYYVISAILIFSSIISFYFSEKIKLYLSISLLSLLIGVYLFEAYLTLKDPGNLIEIKKKIYNKKTGKIYDTRSKFEIYKDLRKEKDISMTLFPSTYLNENDLKLLPLSGVSKSETINCNENGYYSIFKSDRFGFNNPDNEWDSAEIEYLIVGDSYAFGSCLNRPHDIASKLRNLTNKNVLNISYPGNGPLIEYATLREYLNKNVKNIIWLYFEGNDNNDLYNEIKSEILQKYLNDKNFSQNLKKKQSQINLLAKSKLKTAEIEELKQKQEGLQGEILKSKILYFLKLYNTRFKFINQSYPKEMLEEVFSASKDLSNKNGSNFYVVYMPAYARYMHGSGKHINKTFISLMEKLQIDLIDINKEVFQVEKNPLKLFPFELPGHYNIEGYEKVSKAILKITKQ